MKVTKNLAVVLLTICLIPALFAQNICIKETSVFKDDVNFFAMPNAFTPNNDGINDVLPFFNSAAKQRIIVITNPADSTELFLSNDLNAVWDGLDTAGMLVPEGIYKLTTNYLFENDGVELGCRTIYLIRENCFSFIEDSLDFPIDFNEDSLQFNTNSTPLPDCINSTTPTNQITLRMFPNPVSEKIFIESEVWINEIYIFKQTGKMVHQQSNLKNQAIDVSDLPAGIYIIQLKNQQASFSKMIVVQ